MSSSAGQAAEPSLSLHPRGWRQAMVCLGAAAIGAVAGDLVAAGLGAGAVLAPVALGGASLRPLGRQPVRVMLAVALVAPCVRLTTSVILAAGVWIAATRSGVVDPLGFWGAFMLAALGTLAVETLGFAADFRAITRRSANMEAVSA